MPEIPFTHLGIQCALNLATIWLMLEAYFRPPRGWIGGRVNALVCDLIMLAAIAFFSGNFTLWLIVNFGS